MRRDPLVRFAAFLQSNGLAAPEELEILGRDVDAGCKTPRTRRCAAQPSKDTAALWVYSPDVDPTSSAFDTPAQPEGKPDTMVGVINRTLKDEMARNPRIVVFGEDVADASRRDALQTVSGKGGVFKLTHGLQRLYGDDRVFNATIAEASIVGRAIGMALPA
jgi:2-oxoisovalerate dehydrogenase E1 component